jgi:hypothetical protein
MSVDRPPRFRVFPFRDIRPDERVQYVVKGLLPRVGLAVVWGPPKCGKSFWTFDVLMQVALGREYRGHRVTLGPVVYCALEGAQGFRNRVEAFRAAKLSEEGGVASPAFFLMSASLSLAARQLGLRPAWALGSKGAIGTFPVLPGVECLTILAEPDAEREIEACAARWHAAGLEVLINEPIGGKDLNDAIRGAAA